jgi:hypothetical protein
MKVRIKTRESIINSAEFNIGELERFNRNYSLRPFHSWDNSIVGTMYNCLGKIQMATRNGYNHDFSANGCTWSRLFIEETL